MVVSPMEKKFSRVKGRERSGDGVIAILHMLHKENDSVQSPKQSEGASTADIWEKSFPGRRNSKGKAPKVEARLTCSKNSKEINDAGAELAKGSSRG